MRFFKYSLTCCIAVIATTVFLSIPANANYSSQSDFWEASWEAPLGVTGAGLFSVPVEGEKFTASNGTVSHRNADLSMSGNGSLGFNLVRQHEAIPHQYLYAFGNMSFDIPTIQFQFKGNDTATTAMTCGKLEVNATENLFNSINFSGNMGNASLIPQQLIHPTYRALFPSSALLISENNYYLECHGDEYVIHAPDGKRFVFNAQVSAESWWSGYETADTEDRTNIEPIVYDYLTFKIRVKQISRYNSVLNFAYEGYPDVTVSRTYNGDTFTEVREARVRMPLSSGREHQELFRPMRLKSVSLITGAEASENSEVQKLEITYKSSTAQCPGLVDNVHKTFTSADGGGTQMVRRLRYGYRVLHYYESRDLGTPRSGCLLESVASDDEKNIQSGVSYPLWNFEYGLHDGESSTSGMRNYLYFSSTGSNVNLSSSGWDWNANIPNYRYVPLRKVTTPTGINVAYEYFNEVHSGDPQISKSKKCETTVSISTSTRAACNSTARDHVPVISIRKVTGAFIEPHTTTLLLQRENTLYYNLFIGDSKVQHQLKFHRNYPTTQPSMAQFAGDVGATGILLRQGRLLEHAIYDRTQGASNTPSIMIENEYQEYTTVGNGGHIPFTKGDSARPWVVRNDTSDPYNGWDWKLGRRAYLKNNRRVRLSKSTITQDQKKYEMHIVSLDTYGNPAQIIEKQLSLSGAEEHARYKFNTFDNNYQNRTGWIIGLPKSTTQSYDGLGSSQMMLDEYVYNSGGLLQNKTLSGIKTHYQYHNNGNLKKETDGKGNATVYQDYKHGIARHVIFQNNGRIDRVVDNHGNVTSESTDIDITSGRKLSTSYEYNDPFSRLTKTTLPAGRYPIVVDNPIFRGSGAKDYKSTTMGSLKTVEYYDALGRVRLNTAAQTSGNDLRKQEFKYDVQGNTVFASDVVGGNSSTAVGYVTEYDFLGRVLSEHHTQDAIYGTGKIEYCYGASCNTQAGFDGKSNLNNGYIVKDGKGYLTFYETRAFGSPANAQLMEIRQQIESGTNGDEVVTSMTRSHLGDLLSVKQAGYTRTYEPYRIANRPTRLFGSEEHPEFGTYTVLSYDGAGNPAAMTNFNGSVYTHNYDVMNRLSTVSEIGGTGKNEKTDSQSYSYTLNGWVKNASNGANQRLYEYDDDGVMNSSTLNTHQQSFTLDYVNDANGRLERVVYPSGKTVSYTYNAHGQTVTALPYVSNVTYQVDGMPQNIHYGDGSVRNLTYTNRSQTDRLTVTQDEDTLLSLNYDYTERGNLDRLTGQAGLEHQVSLGLSNLQYDGLSRLIRADGAWGIGHYSYDALGNINTKHVGGHNVTLSYDGDNRLHSASINNNGLTSNRTYQYDNNGNITSDSINTYRFDHLNRLIVATSPGSQSNQNVVQTNSYDTDGHRTRMAIDDGTRTETTYFVYSPNGDLMHEMDLETGEQRDHVQFMGKRIATVITHNQHDSDNDGLPDYFERINGLSVHAYGDQSDDPDGDGINNLQEYYAGLSILDRDSDNDGVDDFVLAGSAPTAGLTDAYMPAVLHILQ